MDHQTVGGDKKNLEEDEQVEHVSRQKGPANPHELKLEERVKMPPSAVPTRGHGVDQNNQGQGRGEQDHQRREPVENKDDPERCRPVSQPVDMDRAISRHRQQAKRCGEQKHGARGRRDPGKRDVVAHDKADDRCQQRGQDNGHDDPMHHTCPPSSETPPSSSGSMFIRSSSDSRNAPKPIITRTAVIPKEITIAVRTRACGNGSV